MNNYFPHDSNARNSDKILAVRMKLGVEGYGIYFMILERMREESNYMSIKDYNVIAFDFRVGADKIKSIIEDFGLFSFTDDGKRFYSEGFSNRMLHKDLKSEKARESAISRWDKCERNTNALQTQCERNASKGKEIKVKEIKEEYNIPPLVPPREKTHTVQSDISEPAIHPDGKKEKSCAKKERTAFTPPSVEMVTEFCKENGYTVSAWKFVNYYTSNGWLVGKNKMKDWKAAVRTWQSKENENGNRLPTNNQTNSSGYSNYPKGNDAANKRAELANLKQLAGTILRGIVPKDGG